MEVLILDERPRLRALARADKFDRFVSILVFIPREKYDTDVRTRVAAFLAQIYKGYRFGLLRVLPRRVTCARPLHHRPL